MDFFSKGGDDEVRSTVFGCNKKQWQEIRGEVKGWVTGGGGLTRNQSGLMRRG